MILSGRVLVDARIPGGTNLIACVFIGLALMCAVAQPVAAASATAPAKVGFPVRVELGAEDPALSLLLDLKVDVDAVFDGWARVYVSDPERAKLVRSGFRVTLLPHPEPELAAALREQSPSDPEDRGVGVPTVYHTYATLTADLQAIVAAHPGIAHLKSIGQSVQGRELWMMKLSDNVGIDEDEPELSYIAAMHGDEVVGKELAFNLIEHLTTNYGIDPRVTDLMDGAEIWIMPSMNPDGTELGQRWNVNGVDLNRDFPDQFVDPVNTGVGRQPETALVMQWAATRTIMISSNFHGGALVVNYPFDSNPAGTSTYSPSPDNDEFVVMSRTYADNNPPMSNSNSHPAWDDGITNGADWYSVNGGMQDWNYVWNGGFEVLVELSNIKWPAGSQLPTYWGDNLESLLSYLELGFEGLRGVVTDAVTGTPVAAKITISDSTFPSYTDPTVGDYHRFVVPGTYGLTIEAPGYQPVTLAGVVISAGPATRRDVALNQAPFDPQHGATVVLDGVGGDGWLDPDESADLAITLDNLGGAGSGITATLVSTGPYATVVRADADYPDMAPGGSAESVAPHFGVSLPANTPLGHLAAFVINWQSDQGSGVTAPFFLEVGAPSCATLFSSDLPAGIGDFQSTISRLQFTNAWEIAELFVHVDLTHTYIGDLDVELTAPGGVTRRLHARSGGSANDIVGVYGDTLIPVDPFDPLIGTASDGTWQLRVTDSAAGDTGSLNLFGIEICGQPQGGFCGDGILETGEQCDDGNAIGGDGCSSRCIVEPGAICPIPGEACESTCLDKDLGVGWNMVGPGIDLAYTVSGLCLDVDDDGGTPAEVDTFSNGGWEGHICNLPFNDFSIDPGSGYFLRMDTPGTWCQLGQSIPTPIAISVGLGWTPVALPGWAQNWTASSVCTEIDTQGGSTVEIDRYVNGGWESHICGLPFNDFSFDPACGYFVLADMASTLQLTPDDVPSKARHGFADRYAGRSGSRGRDIQENREVPNGLVAVVEGPFVANQTDTAFTVVWKTDQPTIGRLRITKPGSREPANVASSTDGPSLVHYAVVSELKPETEYSVEIVGSGLGPLTVNTGPTLNVPASVATWERADRYADGSVVIVSVPARGKVTLLAAVIQNGYWVTNLGNLRTKELDRYLNVTAETQIKMRILTERKATSGQ